MGEPLAQRLLLFDGASSQFRTVKLRSRRAGCAACGEQPTITAGSLASYDYAAFTGQSPDDRGGHPVLPVWSCRRHRPGMQAQLADSCKLDGCVRPSALHRACCSCQHRKCAAQEPAHGQHTPCWPRRQGQGQLAAGAAPQGLGWVQARPSGASFQTAAAWTLPALPPPWAARPGSPAVVTQRAQQQSPQGAAPVRCWWTSGLPSSTRWRPSRVRCYSLLEVVRVGLHVQSFPARRVHEADVLPGAAAPDCHRPDIFPARRVHEADVLPGAAAPDCRRPDIFPARRVHEADVLPGAAAPDCHRPDCAAPAGSVSLPFDSADPAAFAGSMARIRALQAGTSQPEDGQASPGQPLQNGQQHSELPALAGPGRRVHVVCRRGNDSQLVVDLLRRQGIGNSIDLIGGLQAWAAQQDPSFPLY